MTNALFLCRTVCVNLTQITGENNEHLNLVMMFVYGNGTDIGPADHALNNYPDVQHPKPAAADEVVGVHFLSVDSPNCNDSRVYAFTIFAENIASSYLVIGNYTSKIEQAVSSWLTTSLVI